MRIFLNFDTHLYVGKFSTFWFMFCLSLIYFGFCIVVYLTGCFRFFSCFIPTFCYSWACLVLSRSQVYCDAFWNSQHILVFFNRFCKFCAIRYLFFSLFCTFGSILVRFDTISIVLFIVWRFYTFPLLWVTLTIFIISCVVICLFIFYIQGVFDCKFGIYMERK